MRREEEATRVSVAASSVWGNVCVGVVRCLLRSAWLVCMVRTVLPVPLMELWDSMYSDEREREIERERGRGRRDGREVYDVLVVFLARSERVCGM